jgi:hypothetical protein
MEIDDVWTRRGVGMVPCCSFIDYAIREVGDK